MLQGAAGRHIDKATFKSDIYARSIQSLGISVNESGGKYRSMRFSILVRCYLSHAEPPTDSVSRRTSYKLRLIKKLKLKPILIRNILSFRIKIVFNLNNINCSLLI